jgi:FtsH-binding integral membrane protein
MACEAFLGKSYAHWFLAALTSSTTASLNPLGSLGVPLTHPGILVLFVGIILGLTYWIIYTPLGPQKYILFILLSVFTGSVFLGTFDYLGKKGLVVDILITNCFIFLAMASLGFLDTSNSFPFWMYLLSAFVGQGLGRLVLSLARKELKLEESLGTLNTQDLYISLFSTTAFALYVAYDTSMLKRMARVCSPQADPIQGAMGMYIDILNLIRYGRV